MNPAAFLPKFFVISSVILILSGTAQLFVRPRKPRQNSLRALVEVVVGDVNGSIIADGARPHDASCFAIA